MKTESAGSGLLPVTDIVDFLEGMGRNAQLRNASAIELEDALIRAGLPPDLPKLGARELEALAGARSNVCCLVYSPNKEEPEKEEPEEDPDEEEEKEAEEKDDTVKKSQDRVRRIA